MSKVATHGKSVWLAPLQSEKVNGKYHIKDTKTFVERKAQDSDLRGWQTVSQMNEDIKERMRAWVNERSKDKRRRKRKRRKEENQKVLGNLRDGKKRVMLRIPSLQIIGGLGQSIF